MRTKQRHMSSLFTIESETRTVKRICGAEKFSSRADLPFERKGNLRVLSGLRSKIIKLTTQFDVKTEIVSKWLPCRIATNCFGEVIDSMDRRERIPDLRIGWKLTMWVWTTTR